jgi:hypothetical protein
MDILIYISLIVCQVWYGRFSSVFDTYLSSAVSDVCFLRYVSVTE